MHVNDASGRAAAEMPPRYGAYRERLVTWTGDLEELLGYARELGLESTAASLERAIDRLASDVLRVAVVGEFKRGKSTLVNALLGRDILPTDVLPCSAAVHRITYGPEGEAEVRYRDGRVESVPPEALRHMVTKLTPNAEATARQVEEAVYRTELPLCAHHVDLIDTPGLNDDEAMTRVTHDLLPTVDAAILVISATSPFSETERDLVAERLLGRELGRLLFVVNGVDRLNHPDDAERVVAEVEARLAELLRRRAPGMEAKVFPLSSYQALCGRRDDEPERIEASGILDFERALERFLVTGRTETLLRATAARLAAGAEALLDAVRLRRGARRLEDREFLVRFDEANARLSALQTRGDEETDRLARCAEELKQRLRPRLPQLLARLEQVAADTVDAAPSRALDFRRRDDLARRLHRAVTAAVRREARAEIEDLQREIERAAAAELERLGGFVGDLRRQTHEVVATFEDTEADDAPSGPLHGSLREGVADRLAGVFDGLARRWIESLRDDSTAVVVGTVSGMGLMMASNAMVSALGLPMAWPVALALGLGSVLSGRYLGKLASSHWQAQEWREIYKTETRRLLRQQWQELELEVTLDRQIDLVFGALAERLDEEMETRLADTRAVLDDLRSHRGEERTLAERRDARLDAIASRCREILEAVRVVRDAGADPTSTDESETGPEAEPETGSETGSETESGTDQKVSVA